MIAQTNPHPLGQHFLNRIGPHLQTTAPNAEFSGLELIDSAAFDKAPYRCDWLVKGVLMRGQPGVIGGGKKCCKTHIGADLAISLATGTDFLGEFPVAGTSRVGLYSAESGPVVLRRFARRLCRARSLRLRSINVFWNFRTPQFGIPEHLAALENQISAHELDVVLIDPLYLSLGGVGGRIDPANMYQVGPVLMEMAERCLSAGATPILIHHGKKRVKDSYRPMDLEELAYAGIGEFARQWMLIARRRPFDLDQLFHELWFDVGGSAGFANRYALDIREKSVVSGERVWDVAVFSSQEAIGRQQAVQEKHREEKKKGQRANACGRVLETLLKMPKGETKTGLQKPATLSKECVATALTQLLDQGLIEKTSVSKAAGLGFHQLPAYRLTKAGRAAAKAQKNASPGEPE